MNDVKLPPLPKLFATASIDLQNDVCNYARAAIEANTPAVPDDFLSHKASWRAALVQAEMVADTYEDIAYCRHELRAFDAAYAALAASPQPVAQPVQPSAAHGWITDWLCPDGTTKPVYSPGPHKPSYGAKLDASLNVYPVFTAPGAQAKSEQACHPGCAKYPN